MTDSIVRKTRVKVAVGVILFLFLCLLLFVGLWRMHEEAAQQPLSPAPRVSLKDGATFVVLDKSTQTQSGIEVKPLEGAVPPMSKVWLDGKTWVYVEKTPGNYEREQSSQVKQGELLVVLGAQLLLSEEYRQVMPANEDD